MVRQLRSLAPWGISVHCCGWCSVLWGGYHLCVEGYSVLWRENFKVLPQLACVLPQQYLISFTVLTVSFYSTDDIPPQYLMLFTILTVSFYTTDDIPPQYLMLFTVLTVSFYSTDDIPPQYRQKPPQYYIDVLQVANLYPESISS